MIRLDERLGAIADLVLEAVADREAPCAADVGCDHGFLTAALLERCPQLTVIASDISAPSLQKARELLAPLGLASRAVLRVADGLAAIDRPVGAIVLAGMGAQTILRIVAEGRVRIGNAALIVQANVDLPVLRTGLAAQGFAVEREVYTCAAGRHYVTMLARAGQGEMPDERAALLGTAADGVHGGEQRSYFAWQRGVRVREMERVAPLRTERARERIRLSGRELMWISEALGMKNCTVTDVEQMLGGIAPYELAEEWDNVGLLVGHAQAQVTRVLVALDLSMGVVEEAKALGAQLIVTHHPIMFSARKRLTDADREGRLMLALAEAGIAHIAAHTNLDSAPGGVNDTLMAAMGAENVRGEGFVRAGDLPEGMTLGALAQRARTKLRAEVRVYGAADTAVHVLGCCSGAGGGEVALAKALGADCFITGEIRHHEALDAVDGGVCVLEAGHFETENPVCEVLRTALQKAADEVEYNLTVFCSKGNPFGR
ncbi:MAG: Nif3-like dinuclear metal center hexameric protein [Clostridiales bacterium]|nr:Nif3-like dinuclear metal center hexameric protein [Clostridiales bacterium]MDY5515533.1 Nif3-like dinuclear metal center hexameric protein [Candidatus Ventricola sp.]